MPLVYDDNSENVQSTDFQCSLAVVIGINNYRHNIPTLRTPGNDARRLTNIL